MGVEKYNTRPKIKLELTVTDNVLESIGWVGLLFIWAWVIANYSKLPGTIPIHFNSSGHPDGYGSKESIIILPVIATIIFAAMTLLNRVPHIFNYLSEITAENALRQYTNATRMMRCLKVIVIIIFGFISFGTIQSSVGESEGLGMWFLPFTLGMAIIPSAYFIIRSARTK